MNHLLLVFCLVAASPAFELKMLDGKTLVGSPVEIKNDYLRIDTPEGRVSLELSDLLSISAQPKTATLPSQGIVIELIDNSKIFATEYVAREKLANIILANGKTLPIPTDIIRSVIWKRETDSPTIDWTEFSSGKSEADILAVRSDKTVEYHKGIIHEVTPDTVNFEFDGEVFPVKKSKLLGFLYHHVEKETKPAICFIVDAFGSRWAANMLKLTDNFQWTTPSGLNVSLPVDAISQVDFSTGKIIYLSDLKPEQVSWVPFFSSSKHSDTMTRFFSLQADCSLNAKPLRIGGNQFAKGLALRSKSELTYRLSGEYNRFHAVAGIDETITPPGHARLIVRGDEKTLVDTVINDTQAYPIDLIISSIRRLTIIVDFGTPASPSDHLLLGDARFSK